jgi:hypothetical protein
VTNVGGTAATTPGKCGTRRSPSRRWWKATIGRCLSRPGSLHEECLPRGGPTFPPTSPEYTAAGKGDGFSPAAR